MLELAFFLCLPLSALLSFYLSLLVHELGHLVAGRLVDFRFLMLIVGPFRVSQSPGGLRLHYSGFRANQFQGRALLIPTGSAHLRRRYLWSFAGGPLATILQILLLLALRYLLSDLTVSFVFDQFLFWLPFTAFALLPFSLLPLRLQAIQTDAAQIRTFLFDPVRTTYSLAQSQLGVASIAGTRPRDFDSGLLQDLIASAPDSPAQLYAHYTLYRHALDKADPALAAASLEKCLAQLQARPLTLSGLGIFIEAAYWEAYHNHDPVTARAWLTLARRLYNHNPWLELQILLGRAEAAILLAETQPGFAASKAREALACLEQSYDQGFAQAEKAWLEALLAQAGPALSAEERALFTQARPPSPARPIAKVLAGTLLQVSLFLVIGVIAGIFLTRSLRYQLVGLFLEASGNRSGALSYLSEGIETLGQERGADNLLFRRGKIYYEQAHYEQALGDFTKAIELEPQPSYYASRGFTYTRLGRYSLAIPDLSQALQATGLTPERQIDLLFYWAHGYYQLKNYEAATADYEQVVELLRAEPEKRQEVVRYMAELGLRSNPQTLLPK